MTTVTRIDTGGYSCFVCTHLPGAGLYGHAHEDMLSYVVYGKACELLIDLGQPDYTPACAIYRHQINHNGLAIPALPLRPNPRFFVTTEMRQGLTLSTSRLPGGAEFICINQDLGLEKSLTLESVEPQTLRIRERIQVHGKAQGARLTLNLADTGARVLPDAAILSGGYAIKVHGGTPELAGVERGLDYGQRASAMQAHYDIARSRNHVACVEVRPHV